MWARAAMAAFAGLGNRYPTLAISQLCNFKLIACQLTAIVVSWGAICGECRAMVVVDAAIGREVLISEYIAVSDLEANPNCIGVAMINTTLGIYNWEWLSTPSFLR